MKTRRKGSKRVRGSVMATPQEIYIVYMSVITVLYRSDQF